MGLLLDVGELLRDGFVRVDDEVCHPHHEAAQVRHGVLQQLARSDDDDDCGGPMSSAVGSFAFSSPQVDVCGCMMACLLCEREGGLLGRIAV